MPAVTPSNPRYHWLYTHSSKLLSVACQIAHIVLVVLSLTTKWSMTDVTFHGNIEPKPVDLYPSTFWTNYDNFMDSGAKTLGILVLLAGLIQPAIKAVTAALHTVRGSGYVVSTASLLLAKYTMVSSNVGVVLLSAVTLTFDLGREKVRVCEERSNELRSHVCDIDI